MFLVCIQASGELKVGDLVEAAQDAHYSPVHFAPQGSPEAAAAETAAAAKPAAATPPPSARPSAPPPVATLTAPDADGGAK